MINRTLPLLLALGLTACASDPAPTEQLRLTEQALAQTKSLGVVSEQSESLRQAEDKFAQAQAAVQDDENKQARQLAEQAANNRGIGRERWQTEAPPMPKLARPPRRSAGRQPNRLVAALHWPKGCLQPHLFAILVLPSVARSVDPVLQRGLPPPGDCCRRLGVLAVGDCPQSVPPAG